jgi:AcrR family transcriptional regulator
MSSRATPNKWTKAALLSRNATPPPAKSAAFPNAHQPAKKLGNSGPKKLDRRIRHTREVLGDALIALMLEKPFDSITIQQVLDRAGIGRSTFYNHFRGKDDLFLSDVEDFFELMSMALTRHNDRSTRLAPVHEFFAHVAEVRPFIRALRDSQKFHDVFELGQGHLARGIESRLAAMPLAKDMNPTGRAARAHALAGALFSLLTCWLNHNQPATPQQMDALFHQLAWSGLQRPRVPSSASKRP